MIEMIESRSMINQKVKFLIVNGRSSMSEDETGMVNRVVVIRTRKLETRMTRSN